MRITRMVVTIDGPAGAGKSSAARALATRLGFRFLDTGAMYRAVAYEALRQEIDWRDAEALVRLARRLQLELTDDRVLLDGRDVTKEIRTMAVTSVIHYVADNPDIRRHLVQLQRQIAHGQHVVTEGRDQGTVVFPDAECKIYLTASSQERARRRLKELEKRGEVMTLDEVLSKQNDRDRRDAEREFGGLQKAPDTIEVLTDGMTPTQVVDRLESLVRSRQQPS